MIVVLVKVPELRNHSTQLVHQNGSHHDTKEHEKGANNSLVVVLGGEVSKANCAECCECEVSDRNHDVFVQHGFKLIHLNEVFFRVELLENAAQVEPKKPSEVTQAEQDDNQLESPDYLGEQDNLAHLGTVSVLVLSILLFLNYFLDPLILHLLQLPFVVLVVEEFEASGQTDNLEDVKFVAHLFAQSFFQELSKRNES